MTGYALIAEFDPQQTAIYRKSIERHGMEAVLVREGSAATRVLQMRGAPTLLISDLSLPQADGFSLIAELRRMSPPDQTAVLVFSAHRELRTAAWNLRGTLGISEVADKNQAPDMIAQAIDRTLEKITRTQLPLRPGEREDELLHKIMFRTSKTFRSPFVLLSIELRAQRRVTGYIAVDELRGGSQLWPVLQQVSSSREPLVVPDITKHSLFGIGPQAPALHVQAFATVPLITSSNRTVGAISLLDFQAQTLTAAELDLLISAARKIADELVNHYETDLADPEYLEVWRSRDEWAALERLALTDRLTGLPNRHAGEQALERELARARRTRTPFSLALIDLDQFKQVNDVHGHGAGDEALKQVSRILTSTFRASDFGVRWGGDEFLVLLPDVSLSGAIVFAERARAQLETLPLPTIGSLTLSAGIVEIQEDEDTRAAIQRADARLYEAKRAGRNQVKG
jgi:diguanylate cyclase (GGDEF)-like protein